jgi:hypothetical protein
VVRGLPFFFWWTGLDVELSVSFVGRGLDAGLDYMWRVWMCGWDFDFEVAVQLDVGY